MRINWGRVKPGQWAEYERRYKAQVEASAEGPQPAARWLARDLDDADAGYAVSLWQSEADMRAYSTDPAVRARIQKEFADLFTGEFTSRLCEVRHERRG